MAMETAEKKPVRAGLARFLQAPEDSQCLVCSKRVYEMEKLTADSKVYHKTCFKCSKCRCTLRVGNYASMEGQIFCKPHFISMFKEKGNYDEGFGKEQHKKKWMNKPEGGATTGSPNGTAGPTSITQDESNNDIDGGYEEEMENRSPDDLDSPAPPRIASPKPTLKPKPKPAALLNGKSGNHESSRPPWARHSSSEHAAGTTANGSASPLSAVSVTPVSSSPFEEPSEPSADMPVSDSIKGAMAKFNSPPSAGSKPAVAERPTPSRLKNQWDPVSAKLDKPASEELRSTSIPAASSLRSRYEKAAESSSGGGRAPRLGSTSQSSEDGGRKEAALKAVNMKNILARFQSGSVDQTESSPAVSDRAKPRPLKMPSFDKPSTSPRPSASDSDRPKTVGQVRMPDFQRQQRGSSVEKPEIADKPTPKKVKIPDFQRQKSAGGQNSEETVSLPAASVPTKGLRDMFENKATDVSTAQSSTKTFDLKAELADGSELEREYEQVHGFETRHELAAHENEAESDDDGTDELSYEDVLPKQEEDKASEMSDDDSPITTTRNDDEDDDNINADIASSSDKEEEHGEERKRYDESDEEEVTRSGVIPPAADSEEEEERVREVPSKKIDDNRRYEDSDDDGKYASDDKYADDDDDDDKQADDVGRYVDDEDEDVARDADQTQVLSGEEGEDTPSGYMPMSAKSDRESLTKDERRGNEDSDDDHSSSGQRAAVEHQYDPVAQSQDSDEEQPREISKHHGNGRSDDDEDVNERREVRPASEQMYEPMEHRGNGSELGNHGDRQSNGNSGDQDVNDNEGAVKKMGAAVGVADSGSSDEESGEIQLKIR